MSFEILCVTMHQTDFSKIGEMNIHSDVVFANQADRTAYEEYEFDGHCAKMITTATRGVGVNRNLGLLYASADICLLADDDMKYADGYEERIVEEFRKKPAADAVIFNIGTTTPQYGRLPTQIKKGHWLKRGERMPYGAPRIAFRRSFVKKNSIFFSTLFGGGAVYSAGEDTLFLEDLIRARGKIWLSTEVIGDVSYEVSSWATSDGKKVCFSRGALLRARRKNWFSKQALMLYYATVRRPSGLTVREARRWLKNGARAYKHLMGYEAFCKENCI